MSNYIFTSLARHHKYLLRTGIMFFLLVGMCNGADIRHNLASNSSFEAGIDYHFSVGRWYISGLPSAKLDPKTKIHGKYSLRIPLSSKRPKVHDDIIFRSAIPVSIQKGKTYTYSVHVRTDIPAEVSIYMTGRGPADRGSSTVALKRANVRDRWQRVSLTFSPEESTDLYWVVYAKAKHEGTLWIDGVQIEEGRRPTRYRPASVLEAGLVTDRDGGIFTSGDKVTLDMFAYNDSPDNLNRVFTLKIFDIYDNLMNSQSLESTIPPNDGIEVELDVPHTSVGLMRAELYTEGKNRPEGVLNYSVLPVKRDVPPEDSAFGAYIVPTESTLSKMSRIGFRWIANQSANRQISSWDEIEREEGVFKWRNNEVKLAEDMGFKYMFNLEPCRTPEWARDLPRDVRLAKWTTYVQQVVQNYGASVKYWTIGDEVHQALKKHTPAQLKSWNNLTHCWTSPAEYAAWHSAGYNAIKTVDPEAKIILNASPEFSDDLLEILPPGQVDILAGNYYHTPRNLERLADVARKHQIPKIWAPGVGTYVLPYYRAHLSGKETGQVYNRYWTDQANLLARNILESLATGAERIFHYMVTDVGNSTHYSLFEADGSLKPNGVQFAALIWLLDGSSVKKLHGTSLEGELSWYRINRNDGKTFFACFREPGIDRMSLLIPGNVPANKINVYDHYANLLPAHQDKGMLIIETRKAPLFIEVPASLATSFQGSLNKVETRLWNLPAARKRIIKGRYAMLTGTIDSNLWRPKPGISFWYRSDDYGWVEILRSRSSEKPPGYRLTGDGIEITWNIHGVRGPLRLEPGWIPANLLQGAGYRASRVTGGKVDWVTGKVDLLKDGVSTVASRGPAGQIEDKTQSISFKTPTGLSLNIDTRIDGDTAIIERQLASYGAWKIMIRDRKLGFLYWHYPRSAEQKNLRIHSKFSVQENIQERETGRI